MIFDPGTKIVFQGTQAEQRATQLCEANPDTTVRISAKSVRLLSPAKLAVIAPAQIQKPTATQPSA